MSDFFDSFVSTGTNIIGSVIDNIQIVRDPPFEHYNAAQRVFGTAGEQGFTFYNLPKFKNCFIIEFVLSPFAKQQLEKINPLDEKLIRLKAEVNSALILSVK